MGKPEIIGYVDEFTGPVDGTIGDANVQYRTFIRRRALYKERPFWAKPTHDGYRLNGWRLYCKRCRTVTMSTKRLPHDLADAHRCLYNPDDKE